MSDTVTSMDLDSDTFDHEQEMAPPRDRGRRGIWRRRPDSNRWMEVLQTSALPLGYVADDQSVAYAPLDVNVRVEAVQV